MTNIETTLEELIANTQIKVQADMAMKALQEISECHNPLKIKKIALEHISNIEHELELIIEKTIRYFFLNLEQYYEEFDPLFIPYIENLKKQYFK